jgi:hypothetical protein
MGHATTGFDNFQRHLNLSNRNDLDVADSQRCDQV